MLLFDCDLNYLCALNALSFQEKRINMSIDKRDHTRTLLNAKIKILHDLIEECMFYVRDISDGGVFVIVGDAKFPTLGGVVKVQMQGLPFDAPILDMVVVRKGLDGFGLKFVADKT